MNLPWRKGEQGQDLPLQHRFALGQTVRYAGGEGAELVVLQRITRESRTGVALSYRCRQIVNGQLLGQRLEVDESELQMRED